MKHLGYFAVLLALTANVFSGGLLLLAAYSPYIDPRQHPLLSCFGLAFPVFALVNGCFLAFWLVLRRFRQALVPLAGFLLCLPQLRTYCPLNLHTDKLPEGSFKMLSYNVMSFGGMEKKDGHNPILDYLKDSRADILCLQEYATSPSAQSLTQEDVEQALKNYPYHHIHTAGEAKGSANKMACYSRFPILSAHTLRYRSSNNGSVAYEIKVGTDTLTLINNHLESNKLTREEKEMYESMLEDPQKENVKSGARQLVRKLAEATAIRAPQADSISVVVARSVHPHIVVCGDFNDSPISYVHRVIARDMDDAFTRSGRGLGISYNQNRFYFRIDNILVSPNLQSFNCTVDRSIKVSDHYPIWCHIAPRE